MRVAKAASISLSVPALRIWSRDHVDLETDEIGGQCRQSFIVALRPAIFYCHVLSLDVASLAQSLVERGH